MANARSAPVFDALGDGTRRALVERLRKGPASVTALAHGLPVSRSAVSQHLRVLREAGLVRETADGTRRIYRLDPRGLGVLRDWLDRHWSEALDSFARFSETQDK
jgi:DNA-binding transcriptional ArsR family regulator